MSIIAGLVIVFGSIFFGFTMHYGQNAMLMQWSEFTIIGGSAAGAFVIANPMHVVKHRWRVSSSRAATSSPPNARHTIACKRN